MSDWDALEDLLRTDARDVGCTVAVEAFPAYVELVASGKDSPERFQGTTAHLRSCEACSADYDALLRAVVEFGGESPR